MFWANRLTDLTKLIACGCNYSRPHYTMYLSRCYILPVNATTSIIRSTIVAAFIHAVTFGSVNCDFFYVIGASLLVSPAGVMNHPFLLYKIDTKQIHYFFYGHTPNCLASTSFTFRSSGAITRSSNSVMGSVQI